MTTFRIQPGQQVICDGCNRDFTDSEECGGVYGLMTKAWCPKCAPRIERQAAKCGESHLIFKRCPPGKSFADWVREDLR